MSQATLKHLHLNDRKTRSIRSLGYQVDEYLVQYSSQPTRVVLELRRFLADYQEALREHLISKFIDEKEISNFFANFIDRLSLRLISPAEGDDDLERVWRSFADESEGKSYKLAKSRLRRVQTLKNKFQDWNVSLSNSLVLSKTLPAYVMNGPAGKSRDLDRQLY